MKNLLRLWHFHAALLILFFIFIFTFVNLPGFSEYETALSADEEIEKTGFDQAQNSHNNHKEKSAINVFQEKKILGGDSIYEAAIGFEDDQIGISGEENPLGPAGFVLSSSGDILILDQFNKRVLVKRSGDQKASILFNIALDEEQKIYSSIALLANQDILLLEGYKTRTLDRYTVNGELVSSTKIVLPEYDEPRNIFTMENDAIFVEGLLYYYKIEQDGTVKKLPGKPFINDSKSFVDAKRLKIGTFQIARLNIEGKAMKDVVIKRPYDAITSVSTDKENNVYVVFDRTVQSQDMMEDGHYQILASQLVIEIFDKNMKHLNTIPFERIASLEYEQDHVITCDGEFLRFVDDEQKIKIIKHVLEKKGNFKSNIELDE